MKIVKLEELQKGSLILVRWLDASDLRGTLEEHTGHPDLHVKDWGVFLGVSGQKRKFLLLGKDVVEVQNDWGATRIPLELVEEVVLLMPRDQVMEAIAEVQVLARRIRLRRYQLRVRPRRLEWLRKALTKTRIKPVDTADRRVRVEEEPPPERFVLVVALMIIFFAGLLILEVAHIVLLKTWNEAIFNGVMLVVGTIVGALFGRENS